MNETKQEIFTKVVIHLLRQDAVSADETAFFSYPCYRLWRLSSAIGCLFNDEQYSTKMEGHSFDKLYNVDLPAATKERVEDLYKHYPLLEELEKIHNLEEPHNWESKLSELAKSFKLEMPKKSRCPKCDNNCCGGFY